VALTALLALAGCGEPDAPAGSGGAGGAGGSGAGSGSAAGLGGTAGLGGASARCNDIVITAPEVRMRYDENPAPAGLGGALADGTYHLAYITWFERINGQALTYGGIQVELAGPSWREGDDWPAGDDPNADVFLNYAVTTSNNLITFTPECPLGGEVLTHEYTAAGNAFTLYKLEGYVVFGYTFELR
jgi:hypothetical protein